MIIFYLLRFLKLNKLLNFFNIYFKIFNTKKKPSDEEDINVVVSKKKKSESNLKESKAASMVLFNKKLIYCIFRIKYLLNIRKLHSG